MFLHAMQHPEQTGGFPTGRFVFYNAVSECYTDDRKLEFLQQYGWLTDDDDVRAYSAKYKPKK